MFQNLLASSRLAILPSVAASPLCPLLLPIVAAIVLDYAATQLLKDR
jgi:hypothetical protein